MPYTKTSKGYKFIEPDYDEPEARLRCMDCGERLPDNLRNGDPTSAGLLDYVVYDEGPFNAPREATEEEIEAGEAEEEYDGPFWKCPHCGYHHNPNEMFD